MEIGFGLNMWITLLNISMATEADSATVNVHHCSEKMQVDGHLDEQCWSQALPMPQLLRYMPTDGGEPPGITDIRVMQSADTLYIGIKVSQANYPIQARISPREDVNDDDQIGIYLDPQGDARMGYIFYINPLGVQQDIRYSNGRWMMEWNTIFTSKGHVTSDGYEIEIAIPFKSLQYPKTQSTWNISVTRKIPALGSKYAYPKRTRNHPQLFLQSVPLENLEPPKQGAGLWIQPTFSGRHSMGRDENNALQWNEKESHWSESLRPSLDMRWSPTPDTALIATTNPDFSQVEGDVRQINLNQRFAFNYPERRPFFLGNIDSFQDIMATLYTRSIVDPISGLKLAGHEGKWDFGALHALDQSPLPSIHEFGSQGFSTVDVTDNWSSTSYLRLRKDAFSSGYFGFYMADKRILSTDLKNVYGFNQMGGLDFRSNIGTASIVQAGSAISVLGDANRTNIGQAHQIALLRSPDLGWGYIINMNTSTQDFRKEMGYLTQSGLAQSKNTLYYLHQIGDASILQSSVNLNYKREFDDDYQWNVSHTEQLNLNGFQTFVIGVGWQGEGYQGDEINSSLAEFSWNARINKTLNTQISGTTQKSLDYGSGLAATDRRANAVLLWRPQSNLRLDLDYAQQWYTLPQKETALIQRLYTRLNWQFTPYLGLRLI